MAATSGEADERVGVSGVLGQLVGRVCALGGRRARLGWLGREAEQAEAACEASLFFFFFYFVFLLLRFESKFVLEFEFKSSGVFVIQKWK